MHYQCGRNVEENQVYVKEKLKANKAIQKQMANQYKKYSSYKDSGIEWIGEIPSHWKKIKIKHLANGSDTLFLDGDWIESGDIVSDEDNIRYITTGNIGEGKYKEQGNGYITEETFKKLNCTEVFPGDLIISRLNPPIGRACIIPELGKRIVTSVDNVILRPSENYSKNFLRHFFTNPKYNAHTLLEGRGAIMQRISRSILGNIEIVFPPLYEQTAIANFLDQKTTQIDRAIELKEQTIALLKERKQIVIQELVTGKWRIENGELKMRDKAELKDSGVEWIGEVPKEWEMTSVKHLLSIPITDGPHSTPVLYDEGIPFISAEAIKNNKIDFDKKRGYISQKDHEEFCRKYKPKTGDIYMVKSGATTGNIAMVEVDFEFSIWSPLAVFRAKDNILDNKYLFYSLLAPYFKKGVELKWSFGTQQNIGMGVLSNLPLIVAPLSKQQTIVHHIEQESTKIDRAISLQEQEIEKLKELKATLIDSAVTGKIKV